ncbi:SMI1/KNR4 family protein [Luteolibacter sp. LG18]|uniref:SMI1/KNR4 family protein n=1 Tax=Luteolibacter sp. LG18 TaxID=2819286 RepID=UPI0030C6B419
MSHNHSHTSAFARLQAVIESDPDAVDRGIGVSPELVARAEAHLGVSFTESLKQYASIWGTLAFGPLEYYGVVSSDFIDSRVPDGVWFTARKRRELDLPANLFVIFNNEGDEFHCVDLETDEIKVWDTAQREIVAVKAANLFEYILEETEDFR